MHITYLDGVTSRTATRDVTVRGGGLHITQLGNVTIATMLVVTCLQFTSRTATRDVTVTGGGLHITQLGNVTIATMLMVTCLH